MTIIPVILLLILSIYTLNSECSYTPIVIWHGIGDTCCNDTTTGHLAKDLQNYLPGIYVISLEIGETAEEDLTNSYVLHPDAQINYACNLIKSDPHLANGYHGVGFSQGGQFLRGLLQRCPEPKMKKLVTMAGQHQGVYGVPKCDARLVAFCNISRQTINSFIYSSIVQKVMVPATYWHNPLNNSAYAQGSTYLSDINNELNINKQYIKNLQSLEKFIMVKNLNDDYLQPIETSWFGFYKNGQSEEVETLQESEIYKTDRLGLKQMEQDGKLIFLSTDWLHAEFDWGWFKNNIVDKYLK